MATISTTVFYTGNLNALNRLLLIILISFYLRCYVT